MRQNELKDSIVSCIQQVLSSEGNAILNLAQKIDASYTNAIEVLLTSTTNPPQSLARPGKVVVTGMGKSGLVARKIAATMASTGTLAIYLHPGEAMHGDLGIVCPEDVVIAIGKSGESVELSAILPNIRKIGAKIIAITGSLKSTLAQYADVILDASVEKEACPHDLAPTTSTAVAMAIGDALAITLMNLKNFKPEDFALYHPGGKLGQRLLLKVSDLMIPETQCPVLDPSKATIEDVIVTLSQTGLGVVLFRSPSSPNQLAGLITDGDIRRLLQKHKARIFDLKVDDMITQKPMSILPDMMAVDALTFLEQREKPLNLAPVIDSQNRLVGLIRLHELLKVA